MFMRLGHVVWSCMLFIFLLRNILLCKHHNILTHFCVNGHFQIEIIMNHFAMSIFIHVFGEHICISVGYMLRCGISGSFGLGLVLVETSSSFLGLLYQLHSHSHRQYARVLFSPHLH